MDTTTTHENSCLAIVDSVDVKIQSLLKVIVVTRVVEFEQSKKIPEINNTLCILFDDQMMYNCWP